MNFINSTTSKAANIFKNLSERYNTSLGFLKNSTFQRWANGIILCLILALILAPEIHFSTPKFKLGMIATKDVKADRDFLVEDQKSTEDKKNDAAENIKPVYD
jgi:membrane-associated HD superfamily phosphohydrolase